MATHQDEFMQASEDATHWKSRHDATRKRLAMLWKAFEDAEARITLLEAELASRTPEVVEFTRAHTAQPAIETVEVEVEPPLQPQPRYPVAADKINKLPGVSKADADKLQTYGVNLTDELLHADLKRLSDASGIALDKLERWRDICELVAINGIGPSWATRLVDADVRSIKALAEMTPEQLERVLEKSYEKQGASEEKMELFRRTLPARTRDLVAAAKKAAKAL
jgi:predicted flap endonuclease-1-like 5' DNA nuclease